MRFTFGTVAGALGASGGMRCLSGVLTPPPPPSALVNPARTGGRAAVAAPRPRLLLPPLPAPMMTPVPGGGGELARLPGRLPGRLPERLLPALDAASVPAEQWLLSVSCRVSHDVLGSAVCTTSLLPGLDKPN